MRKVPAARSRSVGILAALWLAGCVQLPPSPQDIAAKRFEPVADRAVVYLYRSEPDFADDAAGIMLDDALVATTLPGTYIRLELAPGRHRVAGFAGDAGVIEFDARAGRIYFVHQAVSRLFRPIPTSHFRLVDDATGRRGVLSGELIGGR